MLVSFGTQVAFEANLSDALAKVLGASVSGSDGKDGGKKDTTKTTPEQRLTKALADADAALKAADEALRSGDFEAYGKAQTELKDAIDRAIAAQRQLAASGSDSQVEPLPEPTPSLEASPTPESSAAPSQTAAPASLQN